MSASSTTAAENLANLVHQRFSVADSSVRKLALSAKLAVDCERRRTPDRFEVRSRNRHGPQPRGLGNPLAESERLGGGRAVRHPLSSGPGR